MHWDRKLSELVFPVSSPDQNPLTRDIGIRSPRTNLEQVPIMSRGALWLPEIVYPVKDVGDVLRFKFLSGTATERMITRWFNTPWRDIRDRFSASFLRDPYESGHLRARKTKPSAEPKTRPVMLPEGHRNF